jgi:hypothetical protein
MKKAFLTALLLIAGCDSTVTKTYPKVEAVYMHNPGSYSIIYLNGNELKQIASHGGKVQIFTDVELGAPLWAEVTSHTGGSWNDMIIHIHSVNDIGTAGWNAGKQGSGQTNRVDQ